MVPKIKKREIMKHFSVFLFLAFITNIAQADKTRTELKSIDLQPQQLHATKFDISLPLRLMSPKPIVAPELRGGSIIDPGEATNKQREGTELNSNPTLQSTLGASIPGPSVSFTALSNLSGVSPPDPAGDVGPNHYVAMTNLSFHVVDKSGTSLYGPAANNTIWTGFGGFCETDNSGDPIVLYDQIADRWMLSQFTSPSHTEFFNCIAVSVTGDPTGSYYRWEIKNENPAGVDLFPDYPKYGIWGDGYYLSTRDFDGGVYAGIGAYAIKRQDLVNGVSNPTVIYFFVDRSTDPWRVGDGLLPADLDGFTLPPQGSPQYFVGSMDNGGPYSAPNDGLNIWEFHADFDNPLNSTFTLEHTVSISEYDTIFPCSGRNCIPQKDTTNQVDIQSYRQRPLHRLAYRNFGTHESLVTNQSVEAATGIGGIRWWEIRSPDTNPVLHQEGTYAPGVSDNIHRWMGSVAMDQEGNIGLAYSASGTDIFPAIRYTGRLSADAAGSMTLGEGSIVEGTGSQTSSQRWGDYTSLNLDPVDDCTFWHVNEFYDTSGSDWQIRVGAFKFDECGDPGFYLNTSDSDVSVCVGDTASYNVNVGSISQFNSPVTLSISGEPVSSVVTINPNPVTPIPGSSLVEIGTNPMINAGNYAMTLFGTASGADDKYLSLSLDVFEVSPDQPVLVSPANNSVNIAYQPSMNWSGSSNSESYTIEIAVDPGFSQIVFSSTLAGNTVVPTDPLNSNSLYYWRVIATNICGDSIYSETYSFTTLPAPGDCSGDDVAKINYSQTFESGLDNGWTTQNLVQGNANIWAVNTTNPHTGTNSVLAVDVPEVSDQILVSPAIQLPSADDLPISLQFWNNQIIEDGGAGCFDGAIIEISTDGGNNFIQLTDDVLLTDPYDGIVDDGYNNPLAGLMAWCGDPQEWLNSIVELNNYAGQEVMFRFRLGSDSSVSHEGWYIDDVKIQSCTTDLIFKNGYEP